MYMGAGMAAPFDFWTCNDPVASNTLTDTNHGIKVLYLLLSQARQLCCAVFEHSIQLKVKSRTGSTTSPHSAQDKDMRSHHRLPACLLLTFHHVCLLMPVADL